MSSFPSVRAAAVVLVALGSACAPAPRVPPLRPSPPAVAAEQPRLSPQQRLERLIARLERGGGLQTLVLGLETTPFAGYGPLYDDSESPKPPPEDKYRTLVIRFEKGRADLAGDLPFLAIPQTNGFLYMGLASYARDETEQKKRELGDKFYSEERVYWYAASSLWRTTDRKRVDHERDIQRRALELNFTYGHYSGEDVQYATSRALCSVKYQGEVTGGALGFYASEDMVLTGLGKELRPELSAYVGDEAILDFATAILRRRDPNTPDPHVTLDAPSDVGWSFEVDWRKDSRACLARQGGRVHVTGVVRLPNNSARSSEWDDPVREAPPDLAPSAGAPLDHDEVRAGFTFPKPIDVTTAPARDVMLVQLLDRLVAFGAGSANPLLSIPVSGRIVMAEWASGPAAAAWAAAFDPPRPPPPLKCGNAAACGVGTMCHEGACVAPKRIFVTSEVYQGDLGGLEGADVKCQALADRTALDGSYKAWLSSSTVSAMSRLSHAKEPYVLVDGTILAAGWAELTGDELRHAINLTERGTRPLPAAEAPGCASPLIWTSTRKDGSGTTGTQGTCGDWTRASEAGGTDDGSTWGEAETPYRWSDQCRGKRFPCSAKFALFCIEQ